MLIIHVHHMIVDVNCSCTIVHHMIVDVNYSCKCSLPASLIDSVEPVYITRFSANVGSFRKDYLLHIEMY